jgi:DedD protein
MDRRLKERLIGASILVALIVLVVPELLSGPKPQAPPAIHLPSGAPQATTRNVTVDLATSKAPNGSESQEAAGDTTAATSVPGQGPAAPSAVPSKLAAVSPVASATQPPVAAPPAAAATTAAPSTTAAAPPAAAAASAANGTHVETPASSPISPRPGAWAVQLGSFQSHLNAENLSRQLKAQGFSVYVLPGGAGPTLRYRVRIGPLADRDTALKVAAKLKALGHASSLVAPAA